MSKLNYPQEITKDNLLPILKQAKKVKQKATLSLFSTAAIYSTISALLVPLFLFLTQYLPSVFPTMSPESLIATILVFFALILEFVLLFLFDTVELGINRLIKLDHRESVLSCCILMAKFLIIGERKRAKGEVNGFIASLLALKRTSGRGYSQEIDLLVKGKVQIKRMISFSEEKITELLYSFGLALVNNDGPLAYLFLKQIIKETKKYGKLEGLLEGIENKVKSLKGIIALVSSVVVIIATLWGIFKS